ncbi:hypothetical protein GWI33_012678 [Rhynchophorus ferrugineus]|uniref:Uncharacterized protein n=1 Tax=Rhynchophorus ferrugineus TaxID=354439 RepID=A0A834M7B8_RHYFE|nr:hypothetical protein GWI33_012678 [Rhynchophorus ferrugineus]
MILKTNISTRTSQLIPARGMVVSLQSTCYGELERYVKAKMRRKPQHGILVGSFYVCNSLNEPMLTLPDR